MFVTITTADRAFSIGDGSPATHKHIDAPRVSAGEIKADGRTDSEASSLTVNIDRTGGVEALFWPPPVGAGVTVYDSATAAAVVSGVLARFEIDTDAVAMTVQL